MHCLIHSCTYAHRSLVLRNIIESMENISDRRVRIRLSHRKWGSCLPGRLVAADAPLRHIRSDVTCHQREHWHAISESCLEFQRQGVRASGGVREQGRPHCSASVASGDGPDCRKCVPAMPEKDLGHRLELLTDCGSYVRLRRGSLPPGIEELEHNQQVLSRWS